jgi:putative ABC transport system permease protein
MRQTASLREALWVALDSLASHKLRSFLTLLGIVIATTTLIGVIAVIKGMDAYIADRVANMGSNVFLVMRMPLLGEFNPKKVLELLRRNPELRVEEYEYLRDNMTLAQEVGLETRKTRDVRYGNQNLEDVAIRGVTPNIIFIDIEQVSYGRYISEADNRHRAYTTFIGQDLVDRLFPGVDPLGKWISIDGIPYEVVGVAKALGTTFGQSQDNFAYIPIETFFKIYGNRQGMAINVRARGPEWMTETEDQARMLLRARRHLRPGEEDTFGIIASAELMDLWHQLTGAIAAATMAVTSVFLVVGGIVIMNIMLATVTERTHEIGVRKSLGARRRDILMQFLVESALLAMIGGVLGLLGAVAVVRVLASATSVPAVIPVSAIALAVGLSTAVGMFFGIYPARKAAMLDPIVALRAE